MSKLVGADKFLAVWCPTCRRSLIAALQLRSGLRRLFIVFVSGSHGGKAGLRSIRDCHQEPCCSDVVGSSFVFMVCVSARCRCVTIMDALHHARIEFKEIETVLNDRQQQTAADIFPE